MSVICWGMKFFILSSKKDAIDRFIRDGMDKDFKLLSSLLWMRYSHYWALIYS
jgi:hypothetical protein